MTMEKEYSKQEIHNIWKKLSQDQVMIIEFTDYRQYYTAIVSKQNNTELIFEHEVLLQHYDSPFPPHESIDCIFLSPDGSTDITIPLSGIRNIMTDTVENVLTRLKEIENEN